MSAAGAISRGGCHCERIVFEVDGRPERVSECNCSICLKKGYLHFCPNCGVAAFYIPRSDPDKIDVNARCLDGVELAKLKVEHFDGRNWEAAIVGHRATRKE
jgi:hypothetical protein